MKTKRTALALAMVSGIGVLAAVPQAASAAYIQITDDATPGIISVGASDFEGGFSVNGSLIGSGLGFLGTSNVAESGTPVSFSGTWITNGAGLPAASKILFVEGSDPNAVSDILTLSYGDNGDGTGTVNGSFQSGSGLGMVGDYTGVTGTYVETASGYNFSAPYLQGNAVSAVPAPASVWLFGVGMIGLAGVIRRRRKTY